MTRPTAADIREWSKVDFGSLTFSDDADLQLLVDRAGDYIEWTTGRPMDASLPTQYERGMGQAVQYKTEDMAYQDQPDAIETIGDFMLISSFSAGSYSETRRSVDELAKARAIDADPRLNNLLWGLMTDDKRDFWMGWLSGTNAPAFEVTEVDWSLTHWWQYQPGGGAPVGSDAYGVWPN